MHTQKKEIPIKRTNIAGRLFGWNTPKCIGEEKLSSITKSYKNVCQ